MSTEMTTSLASAIGLSGVVAYYSPWAWRRCRMSRIRRTLVTNRILALTYDDGPSEIVTPLLLDLLRIRQARVTFFLLGRNAQRHPEIVDRAIREGHHVGCHSDRHLNAWTSAPWRSIRDINSGYERLSPWIEANEMFRPPYGKMTLPTLWAVRRRCAPVWWWTIDSGDSHEVLPSVSQVAERLRKDGGGIVLMHDLNRNSQRNDFVLELTSVLLDVAQQESLKIMSLRQVLDRGLIGVTAK